jgi:NADPH-dependent 2,4-dienoyl-CoA reductase/sulfur reductase-like enzyme/ferredoxin
LAEAAPQFPNYMQMQPRVPRRLWDALRVASVAAALTLCVSLFFAPRVGIFIFWGLMLPLLPLLFFIAPGFWRNVCPLAASNQAPRRFGFQRNRSLHPTVRSYGFLVPIALFFTLVPARKVVFNSNGTALGILLLATLAAAFAGGIAFKGKSGWCSSFCPLLPVQRVYGQTPFLTIRNSHCEPCVGCAKNCYDFNPHVAQLADYYDPDPYRGAYRRVFVGAFPAIVLAFYTLDAGTGWGIAGMYGRFGLYILGGIGAFYLLESVLRISPAVLGVVFGAAALDLYYWFNWPLLSERIGDAAPWWFVWPARAVVVALSAVWVMRTFLKERRFVEETEESENVRVGAGAESVLGEAAEGRPQVTILPEGKRIAAAPGATLLDVVERHGLPIEAGCRMGMCGSDPICVTAGAEHLSPIGAEERATLERLGLAPGTRMACSARIAGPVSISLTPERAQPAPAPAGEPAVAADPTIEHVVVIGNGIAGVTAADHVRRRHPTCSIDVVARERHHLYNRMAITRLIYGRSAMQSLFLMPESWYDEHRITTWLNTRVTSIDREQRLVHLGTGEALPYDRLILTAGSSGFVPPIEGYGAPGTFALREAEDAMHIRAYVQERRCRRGVVAGGGLLGLEAAYALKKLGLHVTILEVNDRLLHRQLDERAAQLLLRYLEGLGLEVMLGARTAAVETEHGHVTGVRLDDGTTIDAELFLVSAGIRANVDLAQAAGLVVDRGILVNERMQTSDERIFAAGDVAEAEGAAAGLWPTAVEQAEVAAANAVGGEERYAGTMPVTMLKVTGVDLTSVGAIEPTPTGEAIALEDTAESRYRKLVVEDGKLVGAILLGYARESPGIVRAVKEQRDVARHLEHLRAGDWSALDENAEPAAAAA